MTNTNCLTMENVLGFLLDIPGWVLGIRSILKARESLLNSWNDAQAEAFRKSRLNDNRVIATSGSMMLTASVTLLSHTSASQTHPATHCFLLIGAVFSILAVQHALEQSRVLSLLVNPSDLRHWLRGQWSWADKGSSRDAELASSHSEKDHWRGVLAASIPAVFSSLAFHSVMVGCGIHLGTVRSPDDKISPPLRKRPQFIVFIIFLSLAFPDLILGLPMSSQTQGNIHCKHSPQEISRHRIKPTMFTAEAETSNPPQAINRRVPRLKAFSHPILAWKDEGVGLKAT
ncbi:hypothetical protein BP00DRAFT_411333 [Aspergillus indologenus CBS 114.80]|uniref:Uncharacterized protein n=1 Tax=Aspergillus indologenus CBS 114.80 TaxID=1450541 RepID=A0A2V5IQ59_9EURO|nr:hypothetical protein BP00DRAFT_411333 [Aspergillus indologenus CBS 114.80]